MLNFKFKSDHLLTFFQQLLTRNNLQPANIIAFYVTQGPGSFMGVRAGLLFAKTLAATLNKKIYICSTFTFLKTDQNKDIYIKAGGKYFYTLINNQFHLLTGNFVATKPDYQFIENDLQNFILRFKQTDYFQNDALYLKEPTLG